MGMGNSVDADALETGVNGLHWIPPLCPDTGYLLPGRYRTTFEHVYDRFVQHDDFRQSNTRGAVWEGFTNYIQAWKAAHEAVGQPILHSIWIGGSFISNTIDPDDIDVSPVYDEDAVDLLSGSTGIGIVKKLVGHRKAMVKNFNVEPFPIPWRRLQSSLHPTSLPNHAQNYLAKRGGLDDWWQRIRPEGQKGPPSAANAVAARGYLEVTWREREH